MYQPEISDENIRKLYQLKLKKKKPMTHVLDEIIKEYFAAHQEENSIEEQEKLKGADSAKAGRKRQSSK
ncbi:MAG: hypothetical protein AB2L12_11285 [Smithellaceae bacterium]